MTSYFLSLPLSAGRYFATAANTPRTHHTPRANHSYIVKWPGTVGTIFIRASATATTKPNSAKAFSAADNETTSGFQRANARHAAHAAAQPMAQATEPTSVTGTRMASPSSMHAPVAIPTQRTADDGVRNCGCTFPARGAIMPRRPKAKNRRLAATKFPLKHLNNDNKAAARMMLTIQRLPTACSKATAVMNFSPVSLRHGATNATDAHMTAKKK